MKTLAILSIICALCAISRATDAVAETSTQAGPPEVSKQLDKSLGENLAKSEDTPPSGSEVKKEEDEMTNTSDDEEPADGEDGAADNPVPAGFDLMDVGAEDDIAEVDEVSSDEDAAETDEVSEDLPESTDSNEDSTDSVADDKGAIEKRVVGGSVSHTSLWRYQVSIQYRSGRTYRHLCGGILVKRNWVLTAAHCVDRSRSYRIVAGERDLNRANCREQNLGVYRIYVHPGWRRRVASGNDIALVRLSSYVRLNSYVQLAVMPPANQVLRHGYGCYVSGWGRTSTRGRISNQLRHAYLPIVSYGTCRSRRWWGSTVKSNMICAGGDGRRAGCYGDSGGPLSCYVGRRWVVHGVTSFVSSRGCNYRYKPTVFTRISAFRCWMTSLTG